MHFNKLSKYNNKYHMRMVAINNVRHFNNEGLINVYLYMLHFSKPRKYNR